MGDAVTTASATLKGRGYNRAFSFHFLCNPLVQHTDSPTQVPRLAQVSIVMAPFPRRSFCEDRFALYPIPEDDPTDYKYKGDMKKRSDIVKKILTTNRYAQQLNVETRAGLDVPDATDITITKRQWDKAVFRFKNHIRDVYMRQLTEDLELWDLEWGGC